MVAQAHRTGSLRSHAAPDLNLTSMIDVVFLLLVYFLITASFAPLEGVLPASLTGDVGTSEGLSPPKLPLDVRVSSAGLAGVRIAIEQAPQELRSFSDLSRALVTLQHDPPRGRYGVYQPDCPVVIHAEGHVHWQHVVGAFNAAVGARYRDVRFAPIAPG